MILIFNSMGLIMLSIGAVFLLIVGGAMPRGYGGYGCYACAALWIVWDFTIRWRNRDLLTNDGGGHLYYIPMWLLALPLIWMGVKVQEGLERDRQQAVETDRQFQEKVARFRATSEPATEPASEPASRPDER